MDEIKKAYREQIKKYHPDKVESLKLGPEYRSMFEEKTMEIQKAYESLGGK
jgi:molecular chaperone DnaJ